MNAFLLVFLGGGLGSVCRYAISTFTGNSQNGFPLGTFIANVLSCIILAFLMIYFYKKGLDQKMQLLFMTGFCGGFSTFSTFSAETFRLIQDGHYSVASVYVISSILICCSLIFLIYYLGIRN